MNKNSKVFEVIIITLLAIMAGFAGVSMSIVGLVYPILLTLIGIKSGISRTIVSFLLSISILIIIELSIDVVILYIRYGLLSIATVYMIRKGYKASKVMAVSVLVLLISSMMTIGFDWYVNDINIVTELDDSLSIIVEEQIKSLETQNFSSREVSMVSNVLKNMVDYITSLMPVILIISATILAYINYYIPTKILRRSGRKDIQIPYFSRLILPTNSLSGLGFIFVLTYLLKYISGLNYDQTMLNVSVLIFYVFTLEGLSLITFMLNKAKVRSIFKYIILLAIMLTGFLSIAVFSIGIIDVVIDFRKFRKPRSS